VRPVECENICTLCGKYYSQERHTEWSKVVVYVNCKVANWANRYNQMFLKICTQVLYGIIFQRVKYFSEEFEEDDLLNNKPFGMHHPKNEV
jgi:hypothetical protein